MERILTTSDIAELTGAHPQAVRRAVDALAIELPRAGQYRLVPESILPLVRAELERRGALNAAPASEVTLPL